MSSLEGCRQAHSYGSLEGCRQAHSYGSLVSQAAQGREQYEIERCGSHSMQINLAQHCSCPQGPEGCRMHLLMQVHATGHCSAPRSGVCKGCLVETHQVSGRPSFQDMRYWTSGRCLPSPSSIGTILTPFSSFTSTISPLPNAAAEVASLCARLWWWGLLWQQGWEVPAQDLLSCLLMRCWIALAEGCCTWCMQVGPGSGGCWRWIEGNMLLSCQIQQLLGQIRLGHQTGQAYLYLSPLCKKPETQATSYILALHHSTQQQDAATH